MARIRSGPFELFHTSLAIADGFVEHHHRRPHLVMVFRGAWSDRSRARRIDVGAGEVLFHPARFVHSSGAVAESTEIVVMRIDVEVVQAFCPLYDNVARDVHLPFESVRGVPDRIREELVDPDDAAPVILESLAMQLLALGSRMPAVGATVPPSWFPAVMGCIRESYTTPINARTLAARAGVSESRVAHVFREVMGRSIADYVRECRVRAAAKALRETDTAIGGIAVACGFYDQAHLTRAFKTLRCMTPQQYRRSHQRP